MKIMQKPKTWLLRNLCFLYKFEVLTLPDPNIKRYSQYNNNKYAAWMSIVTLMFYLNVFKRFTDSSVTMTLQEMWNKTLTFTSVKTWAGRPAAVPGCPSSSCGGTWAAGRRACGARSAPGTNTAPTAAPKRQRTMGSSWGRCPHPGQLRATVRLVGPQNPRRRFPQTFSLV